MLSKYLLVMELRFDLILYIKFLMRPYQMITQAASSPPLVWGLHYAQLVTKTD